MVLPHGILAEIQIEELRQEADKHLRLAMRSLQLEGETIVSRDTPAQAIVHMAEDLKVELIVLGTSGKTGLARWVLGSVAETVVRNSRCSTLVVRLHGNH
jgi:nucleotide-binding universal stress UspA family protein